MEWVYTTIGVLSILLILGLLSSCAVVKTDYSASPKKNATVYYYLPESIIKIHASVKVAVVYNSNKTLTASSKVIEETFIITTEMIADTKDLLSLNYKPNALMADDIKYAVNAKGLLETVNITTEDRTAYIISKLAEAPKIILGASAGTDKAEANGNIIKIKELTSDFAIKASAISNNPLTVKWNINIFNELGVDEKPSSVPADFVISSPDLQVTPPRLSEIIDGSSSTETEGILTRPIKNISLIVTTGVIGVTYDNTLPLNLVVADVAKLIVIPVNRTAFAKRINKIGIQDGIILSNEINKPSSVEGFVSIPINIAKAVVSIPGQLIQFRFDNTKRLDELEKEKLNYEKSIQEGKKFALTKDQEIDKLKSDIQKADLSNQFELQKLKLDLQSSILDAEKKQLEAQKALDELKKQIGDLKTKQ